MLSMGVVSKKRVVFKKNCSKKQHETTRSVFSKKIFLNMFGKCFMFLNTFFVNFLQTFSLFGLNIFFA